VVKAMANVHLVTVVVSMVGVANQLIIVPQPWDVKVNSENVIKFSDKRKGLNYNNLKLKKNSFFLLKLFNYNI